MYNDFLQEPFENLQQLVLEWAEERGILANSPAAAQLLKTVAEVGELADAHNKMDKEAIVDGVGDVLVCLINYCAVQNINPVHCLAVAYDEIKDRKGFLNANGVFVKQ